MVLNTLIIAFGTLIGILIVFLGGTILFAILLIKKVNKNKEIGWDFFSKLLPSMVGGLVVFFATQLKGVNPLSINGSILFLGGLLFIFMTIYIGFIVFYNAKKKKESKN